MTFVWQRKMVGREIAKLPVRGDTPPPTCRRTPKQLAAQVSWWRPNLTYNNYKSYALFSRSEPHSPREMFDISRILSFQLLIHGRRNVPGFFEYQDVSA